MRYMILSLLGSLATYNVADIPKLVSNEDSKKIVEISKQIVAHPELNADLIFSKLDEFVSSPELLTQEDIQDMDVVIPPKDLEVINEEFFQGMKNVVEDKFPELQELIRNQEVNFEEMDSLEDLNL